ncbi:ChaC-like protein [Oceanicola granulosus HTCC2516]|uniref:glutathione-specific gamma-glutamylcyclotransferase n=1 Tax=Oceanicola granulosus (strain ATCC BAA-861 / DSM 15982 / KCTC 12143 / HTCC2516) TaxID=314256 RepID=Q2CB48_OCEGH|nr:gamma-glutamylcyclotransferase [Oceanicola granulosus]EAR49882.1 ChaC-like protein [Oceanicola granulosus HTCC2516]
MTLWVFGYGSLLWNPGFVPAETALARLDDYHRSFCMLSIHHRGSEAEPGLVLALDAQEGAVCTGLALRVAPADEERVLAELRERELISSAYYEARVPLALTDGREVEALAYIVDATHRQYVQIDLETQARMIARAHGGRGPNTDYLVNTHDHLGQLGIHDPDMDWLVARVRDIVGEKSAPTTF